MSKALSISNPGLPARAPKIAIKKAVKQQTCVGTGLFVIAASSAFGASAPILVLLGRLLQGFSAGMELGVVSVYLSEIATPNHKGFYVSWQSASQQVAVMFAALLGVLLNYALPPNKMALWGWRIPLLVGCLIVPFLFRLRQSLEETDEFLARPRPATFGEIYRSLRANAGLTIVGMVLFMMTTVSFYMITAYTPTFGSTVLHLSSTSSFVITFCVGASNLFWLPVIGSLSDRVGRFPILFTCTALMLITAYPAMHWIVASPSFSRLLVTELWLSFIYASYNGAVIVLMTEIVPLNVRTLGFSLAYSLATAVFGGYTPAISTYLIHTTGNRAMPGAYLAFAAACSLSVLYAAKRIYNRTKVAPILVPSAS